MQMPSGFLCELGFSGLPPAMENLKLKSEMIKNIAVSDTIIINFPLSIFNLAAERLPDKPLTGRRTR